MRQIYYYPYNASKENETKIFLSDKVFKKIDEIYFKNRNIIIFTKKKFLFSVAIVFETLSIVPAKSESIGLPLKFNQVIEISRPVENYVYQYAPTVKPKVDKVTFIKYKPLPLCIYLIDNRFLNSFDTRHIVNTIRGGGLIESAAAFLALFLFWQLVSITIDGFIYDHRNPFLGINNQHHRPGRAQKYPPINNIFFPEEKSHCNSNTY